jgi:hypothetical protein
LLAVAVAGAVAFPRLLGREQTLPLTGLTPGGPGTTAVEAAPFPAAATPSRAAVASPFGLGRLLLPTVAAPVQRTQPRHKPVTPVHVHPVVTPAPTPTKTPSKPTTPVAPTPTPVTVTPTPVPPAKPVEVTVSQPVTTSPPVSAVQPVTPVTPVIPVTPSNPVTPVTPPVSLPDRPPADQPVVVATVQLALVVAAPNPDGSATPVLRQLTPGAPPVTPVPTSTDGAATGSGA